MGFNKKYIMDDSNPDKSNIKLYGFLSNIKDSRYHLNLLVERLEHLVEQMEHENVECTNLKDYLKILNNDVLFNMISCLTKLIDENEQKLKL